jgi:hypothetical protein
VEEVRFASGHRFSGAGGSAVRISASLYRLRKNSGSDFALKGRGFSRAVSVAKSSAALAADAPPSHQDDFFRKLFSEAGEVRFVSPHRFSDAGEVRFASGHRFSDAVSL